MAAAPARGEPQRTHYVAVVEGDAGHGTPFEHEHAPSMNMRRAVTSAGNENAPWHSPRGLGSTGENAKTAPRRPRAGTGASSSLPSFSHPDFDGRPRNLTGSTRPHGDGFAGCTAGGDLHPAPKEKIVPEDTRHPTG